MGVASVKDEREAAYARYKWPVVCLGAGMGVYLGSLPAGFGSWVWFSWHPLAMSVASLTLAVLATLLKKIGGLQNTVTHGYLMSAAMSLMLFGFYVIYSNKDSLGKEHFQTWHSWAGAATAWGFLALALGASLSIHPVYGMMRSSTVIRTFHKYGGKALLALSWTACMTGFMTMVPDVAAQAAFGVALAGLAVITLRN